MLAGGLNAYSDVSGELGGDMSSDAESPFVVDAGSHSGMFVSGFVPLQSVAAVLSCPTLLVILDELRQEGERGVGEGCTPWGAQTAGERTATNDNKIKTRATKRHLLQFQVESQWDMYRCLYLRYIRSYDESERLLHNNNHEHFLRQGYIKNG